jgi:hypothetical protein
MRREQCISLGLALLAACSSRPKDPTLAGVDTTKPIVAAPVPAPGDTSCPATGLWARCSVIKAIERAGLNAHADSLREITEKPLTVPGFELPISRGTVRVFLYADSNSRKHDQLALDPMLFVTPKKDPQMRKRTLVATANLIALMDVMNTQNRERIFNAMLAGAPQPPRQKP